MRTILGVSILLAALTATTAPGAERPAECLRPILTEKCQQVAQRLTQLKVKTIRLPEAMEPNPVLVNARPGMVLEVLTEEFKRHEIEVLPDAPYELQVDYSEAVLDAAGDLRPLNLKMKLVQSETHKEDRAYDATVTDRALLQRLQGKGSGPLQVKMVELARKIAVELDQLSENRVALLSFQGPDGDCNGIAKQLTDALVLQSNSKGKIVVDETAPIRMVVRCEMTQVQVTHLALTFQCELKDRLGKQKCKPIEQTAPLQARDREDSRDTDGIRTAMIAAAVTGTFPPNADTPARVQAYIAARVKPEAIVEDGHWVRPSKNSPFAAAIRVGGEFRPVTLKGGEAFVALKKGEIYEVVVRSKIPGYDTAIGLTLDGLSMFAFSKYRTYTEAILGMETAEGVLTGWHLSNDMVDLFQIMALPNTPAAKNLASGTGIGTINVTFAAAWPKGATAPPDEAQYKNRGPNEQLATGRGPTVAASFKEVERSIGVVRGSVTFRYSRGN